jgi:hypothetical protein
MSNDIDIVGRFVTPAVVSAVVTGVLLPLLLHFMRRRDERQRRLFDIRYEEYRKYLTKLDEIAEASRVGFDAAFKEQFVPSLVRLVASGDDPAATIEPFMKAISELMDRSRDAFMKAKNELGGLRLVCSDQLLPKIERFVDVQKALLDESLQLLGKWKTVDLNNPETALSPSAKAKSEESERLLQEIVKLMRAELASL